MAISCRIIHDENLFIDNDSLILNRNACDPYDATSEIAAISIVCRAEGLVDDILAVDVACGLELSRFLTSSLRDSSERRLWLFAAHGPWQGNSAMVRHWKLWKALSRDFDTHAMVLGSEIAVSGPSQSLKYALTALVEPAGVLSAMRILRSRQPSFLIWTMRQCHCSNSYGIYRCIVSIDQMDPCISDQICGLAA